MWTAFVSRFYSLFFALLMLFGSVSIPGGRICRAQIDYAFADDLRGTAGGTVSVSVSPCGTYQLYWGDKDGKKLSEKTGAGEIPYTEFAEVTVSDGSGSAEIYEYVAIPEGAETRRFIPSAPFRTCISTATTAPLPGTTR